eukprot:CAMPEP_0119071460 /NCGR_PEP_ID=MMETSP1178-20130426/50550_1 /TAXON_ID=33656 /ORGANISM="unid sp, Strain CCMP2000" /LENGTH=162 /DNA_ID=CAMNT_0007053393 /DNA_START=252 /DNA_END=737 /DNA_ORIENTATION=-
MAVTIDHVFFQKRCPVAWRDGQAGCGSLVDFDDGLLHSDCPFVQENIVGRRQEVVVDAAGQLLDLFYDRGRDPEGQHSLERLAPEALVHDVRLPSASRFVARKGDPISKHDVLAIVKAAVGSSHHGPPSLRGCHATRKHLRNERGDARECSASTAQHVWICD